MKFYSQPIQLTQQIKIERRSLFKGRTFYRSVKPNPLIHFTMTCTFCESFFLLRLFFKRQRKTFSFLLIVNFIHRVSTVFFNEFLTTLKCAVLITVKNAFFLAFSIKFSINFYTLKTFGSLCVDEVLYA